MSLLRSGYLLNTAEPSSVISNTFTVQESIVTLIATNLLPGIDFVPIEQRIPALLGQPERWIPCFDEGLPLRLTADNTRIEFLLPGTYRLGEAEIAESGMVFFEERSFDDLKVAFLHLNGDVTANAASSVGTFSVAGNSGTEVISSGDTLSILGVNLITTRAVAVDTVEIRIDAAGAIPGQVVTFDGADVSWQGIPVPTFRLAGETGGIQILDPGDTITITGSQLLATTSSAVDTVDVRIDTTGALANQVPTFSGGNVVWATPSFSIAGILGSTQTISSGDTLGVIGSQLITTMTSATDMLEIRIDTSGASIGQVITFDGANATWQLPPVSSFTVAGVTGSPQTISSGDTLNVTGSNLITTRGINTDNLDIFINTSGATTDQVVTYNGASVVWATPLFPSQGRNVVSTSTNLVLTTSNDYVLVDTTAGNIGITLPTTSTMTGRRVTVKKTTSDVNTITVTPTGGLIDGAATHPFSSALGSRDFVSDGTNWAVV